VLAQKELQGQLNLYSVINRGGASPVPLGLGVVGSVALQMSYNSANKT